MAEEKINGELFLGQGSLMCGALAQKLKSVENLSSSQYVKGKTGLP